MLKEQQVFGIYGIIAVICYNNDACLRTNINKMSEIAIESHKKNAILPFDENLTAYINGLIEAKIEKLKKENQVGGRLITRTQIVKETSRRLYEKGVREGPLNPIADEGRNAQHYIYRSEYDAFLRHLQMRRNN